jgi:GNAT superfamily N-acetyltransferase
MWSVVGTSHLVRGLQDRVARAHPAEHTEDDRGWRLRLAPGCAWWVATVQPHRDAGRREVLQRVLEAERFYARHRTPARFQVSPPACPEALDTVLASRGYDRRSPMSLQAASTAAVRRRDLVPASRSLEIRLDHGLTPSWFDVWHGLHGEGADPAAERQMLGRVAQPTAYAAALMGGEVVGIGRVVADTGWAGVFGMATVPRARGRGVARAVLAALAGWAARCGTERMYLQVERDNGTGLRLYGESGFRELSRYHYRSLD